jgi:integral membrane sensor domain MASE1
MACNNSTKKRGLKMKDKVIFALAVMVGAAIITAIVGDYITAALETQRTGEPVEVSAEVMTLVQTALGGLIGIIGGYFGAKGSKD